MNDAVRDINDMREKELKTPKVRVKKSELKGIPDKLFGKIESKEADPTIEIDTTEGVGPFMKFCELESVREKLSLAANTVPANASRMVNNLIEKR